MKSLTHLLPLFLPTLFLACGREASALTVYLEEKQRSLGTDDGLEGRHGNDDGPECPFPYVDVNDMCLYAFCSTNSSFGMTYLQASATCMSYGLGGNLAIFNSGNQYNNILSYLKQIDPLQSCNYWVGGSNQNQYGAWRWYTGALVPSGIPFWGTSGTTVLPPLTASSPSYTLLESRSNWAMINADDQATGITKISSPLCQYRQPKRRHHHKESSRFPSGYLLPVQSFSLVPSFPYPQHHHHQSFHQ